MLRIGHGQAMRYRLHVNHLTNRLPTGDYDIAARSGIQDSGPRSGLISLAARVQACTPDAWCDPRLVQTYSPRAAVHLLPRNDFGVFTLGRLPRDPDAVRGIEQVADRICQALAGRTMRSADLVPSLRDRLRHVVATGRIMVRWDARSLLVRECPRPAIDPADAAAELASRHLHYYGPTTPELFARWAGLSPADGRTTWSTLSSELRPVRLDEADTWIAAADEELLATAPEPMGFRFLPAEELRLFEHPDAERVRPPFADTFHPHGLLVDGSLLGSWARRGGRFELRLRRQVVPESRRGELDAEISRIPIPGRSTRLDVVDIAT
jgi:Winged helix DNA-binding domain